MKFNPWGERLRTLGNVRHKVTRQHLQIPPYPLLGTHHPVCVCLQVKGVERRGGHTLVPLKWHWRRE